MFLDCPEFSFLLGGECLVRLQSSVSDSRCCHVRPWPTQEVSSTGLALAVLRRDGVVVVLGNSDGAKNVVEPPELLGLWGAEMKVLGPQAIRLEAMAILNWRLSLVGWRPLPLLGTRIY